MIHDTPTTCCCGHARDVHEHLRPGWDCGVCGVAACPRYRRPASVLVQLRTLIRTLGGVNR